MLSGFRKSQNFVMHPAPAVSVKKIESGRLGQHTGCVKQVPSERPTPLPVGIAEAHSLALKNSTPSLFFEKLSAFQTATGTSGVTSENEAPVP